MARKTCNLVWDNISAKPLNSQNSTSLGDISIIKNVLSKAGSLNGESLVIKLPSNIIEDDELLKNFAENIALLQTTGAHVVIVHEYESMLKGHLNFFGIEKRSDFMATDFKSSQIMEMIISGYINKKITTALCNAGATAIGISGKDANMIRAENSKVVKKHIGSNGEEVIEVGFSGTPTMINPEALLALESTGMIVVLSPIASCNKGNSCLLDADLVSAIIASAITSSYLIFLTPEGGIKKDGELIMTMGINEVDKLVMSNKLPPAQKGMVEAGISAMENHTETVYLLNSKIPNTLLHNLFTEHKDGTKIDGLSELAMI